MTDGYRSRKLIFTLLVYLTATLFRITDLIGSGEWITIATLVLTIYAGANVMEKK